MGNGCTSRAVRLPALPPSRDGCHCRSCSTHRWSRPCGGAVETVQQVLATCGWQINTAFVERLNLTIRQQVAAVGRRVNTLCKGEEGLRQQLTLYHVYYNFCLPHTSLRQPLSQPEPPKYHSINYCRILSCFLLE